MSINDVPFINWSLIETLPESTCYCFCGSIYKCHARSLVLNGSVLLYSRKACPGCSRHDNLHRISHDRHPG